MAETQVGKGHGFSLTGALVDLASGAYYSAKINLQSVRVATNGDLDEVRGQTGGITSVIASADALEATFDVIPQGATLSNAYDGCRIPPRLSAFNASGFGTMPSAAIKNIPIGPFTNSGINNTGSGVTDTQPWFFISGELTLSATGKWMMSWVMRRWPEITSGTVITST